MRLVFAFLTFGHTLTGVWVEIELTTDDSKAIIVTPSRVCELKSVTLSPAITPSKSHPHGCVSWNWIKQILLETTRSHTLTGVWVEMLLSCPNGVGYFVTPSRVCELKLSSCKNDTSHSPSHPHGCVSWNTSRILWRQTYQCHTLTGVWVEI